MSDDINDIPPNIVDYNYSKNCNEKNCCPNQESKQFLNNLIILPPSENEILEQIDSEEKLSHKNTTASSSEVKLQNAMDFFDNENLIYMSLTDVKNSEKINKFIHEELSYPEVEDELFIN